MAIEPLQIYRGVNIDGKIINNEFFPLTPRVSGTTQTIVSGAGIRFTGSPSRIFINVSINPIDVDDNTVFTDRTMWREWFSGGSANGTSLTNVEFFKNMADGTPFWDQDPTDTDTLIVTLNHNLSTQNINVKFYETGDDADTNASVFVSWEYNPGMGEGNDSIIACIPNVTDAAFTGVVRITSDIATATPERYFEHQFVLTDWEEHNSEKSRIEFDYDFSSERPQTEVYDISNNEVLLEIERNTAFENRLRLIVYKGDEFAGYVAVRG